MAYISNYSREYRIEAANIVIETRRSVAAVSRDIGVNERLLGRWVREQRKRVAEEPRGALSVNERAQLKQLKKEIVELRQHNEFLGQAAAFFAMKSAGTNGIGFG